MTYDPGQPGAGRKRRLEHQLKLQSLQIERVFDRHRLSAQVAGGSVEPRSIIFDLQTQLAHGVEKLRGLKQDLMTTLGVADIELRRDNGTLRLHITRPDDPPVSLLDLLDLIPELPPATAVLGLAEDGRPVLLDFTEMELPHVLLTGGPGAGKTALLRTLAVSLVLTSRQSQLQLIVADPVVAFNEGEPSDLLRPLAYLPHLLTTILHTVEETAEMLNFLFEEMAYRQEQQVTVPSIVVLIDNVERLLEAGGEPIAGALMQLAQSGAETGIHLVLSTRHPDSSVLDTMLKANLPVRIVGQVEDEDIAWAAAGTGGALAHYLLGEGDFVAITGETMTRFQAAYIGDYDLHLTLESLYRNQPPSLLAHPVNVRTTLSPEEEAAEDQLFLFGEEVAWSEPLNGRVAYSDGAGEETDDERDIPFGSAPDEESA